MGWVANLLLLWSWWALGRKLRCALLIGILGSLIWGIAGYQKGMWDLVVIEVLLASFQLRAWYLWGRDDGSIDGIHSGATRQ